MIDELPKALVLFSGGLDSTTALYIARARGFDPIALGFDYDQRHRIELERAAALASRLGVPFRRQSIDMRSIGGSALTDGEIAVPKGRGIETIAGGGVPPTYVPARNTIFLAHALAWAEVDAIDDIFLGINALDYSGYPDCRPEYLAAFEALANLASARATEGGARLRFHAPLIDKTKAEIVRWGLELGVDHAATWSCYDPVVVDGAAIACGVCDSCQLRRRGFGEAGVADPTRYAD